MLPLIPPVFRRQRQRLLRLVALACKESQSSHVAFQFVCEADYFVSRQPFDAFK